MRCVVPVFSSVRGLVVPEWALNECLVYFSNSDKSHAPYVTIQSDEIANEL